MGTKILVTYASKYGSTAEIAEKIGQVIKEAGLDVEVLPVIKVKDLSSYQAVILGSAVYMGSWRREAGAFLKANEKTLSQKAVWLFSSGPTNEGDVIELLKDWTFPRGLQSVADRVKFRDHGIFHGDLREDRISRFEKWVIKKVKAPVGDFRDWAVVTKWAESIAVDIKKG